MAKGDRFEVGDAIRVQVVVSPRHELDCIILKITKPGEYYKGEWPWVNKTKLDTAYIEDDGQWHRTWWHAEDAGVSKHPDADAVIAKWTAHILIHGEPPFRVFAEPCQFWFCKRS